MAPLRYMNLNLLVFEAGEKGYSILKLMIHISELFPHSPFHYGPAAPLEMHSNNFWTLFSDLAIN